MSEKRALTKFLRCVEWSDVQVRVHLFSFLRFLFIVISMGQAFGTPCLSFSTFSRSFSRSIFFNNFLDFQFMKHRAIFGMGREQV